MWRKRLRKEAELKAHQDQALQAEKEATYKQNYPEFRRKERQRLMEVYEKRNLLKKKQPEKTEVKRTEPYLTQVAKRQQREGRQKANTLELYKTDPDVVQLLSEFRLTLQAVFTRFAKLGQPSGFYATGGLLMTYQGYNRFMNDFNVYPGLIGQQDNLHFFKLTTKDQMPKLNAPVGFDDLDFNDVIIRVAIAAADKLNSEDHSPALTVKRLFEWLGLSPNPRLTSNLLKEMASSRTNLAPREKRSMKMSPAHQMSRRA
jgi:hypothetical protein